MPTSTRFTMVENEDFRLDCEYNDEYFILHLPHLKPKPGSVKHLKIKLEELSEFVDKSKWHLMFTAVDPDNKPVKKILNMVGAKYHGTAEGLDVYYYPYEGDQ